MKSMKIAFIKKSLPKQGILVALVVEGDMPSGIAADLDKKTNGAVKKAYQAALWKGGKKSVLDIVAPNGLDVDRLILVGIGKPQSKDSTKDLFEAIGGMLVKRLSAFSPKQVVVLMPDNIDDAAEKAASLGFGAVLGDYRFDLYRTKLKAEQKRRVKQLSIALDDAQDIARAKKSFAELSAVADGIYLARDLAHEPANILYPGEFAKRTRALSKLGVQVEILNEAQMKKMGMGALLGVGQGSVRESHLVVMRWNGAGKSAAPFAVVGKGVCFDTGGISLKPAGGMEDMKADMGGAACVTGVMHALATRKAKVNVVGVIGLVENMPDGNAQRPGDIVRSMSGQTIEVLNTDAEGRLVLADALWYTQEKFKPVAVVNFATLTGAILVALGREYAGLFSNNDELAGRLYEVGVEEGEKVWRLPMSDGYNKMIDSKTADIKNIGGGREAGSITAAQFLQRFIKDKQPWAHVDIAGTAMGSPRTDISPAWASGFGVRLINGLVKKYYENGAGGKSASKAAKKKKSKK